MAGFHVQRTVPNWLDGVARLPNGGLVKATEDYQMFREVKEINPALFTVHRMVRDGWQNYDGQYFDWEVGKQCARDWFNAFIDGTFRDAIAPYCDAVSWHNEIWANSQTAEEQAERIQAARAAAYIWNNEYRHTFSNDIKLIIGEAAIGNWMPREVALRAIDSDNLLGYHPYDYWRNKVRGDEGFIAATSMLWDSMEYEWGLRPTWVFTEAGPFEAAETGWRSPICLDHDRAAYINAMRIWIRDVAQTPAYREGRIKGFALFTTGGGDRWAGFETSQPELNELADMMRIEWHPGTAPPPPPPPPPVDGRGLPRIQYGRVYNVIPQDATEEQAVRIFRLGWNEAKQTSGGSYDDAGVGDLDSRTAILWDIPLDEQATYRDWFAAWYPGVYVQFASGGEPEPAPANTHEIIDIIDDLPVHGTKTYSSRLLSAIETLTIHHTVSPPDRSIESIARYHIDARGWPGIAYHYVITDDGRIYQTNADSTISYHCGNQNGISVGIALQGDFTNAPPPDAQLEATRWLVGKLCNDLQLVDVRPHRNMQGAATACPGNTWEDWFDVLTSP